MQFKISLMGFLCIKAELLMVILSMRGIDKACHTRKDGVNSTSLKDDFSSLEALAKNLMLVS